MVEILLDQLSGKESFFSLVNFAHIWVLPLESSLLFSSSVSILFDGLEHSRSELGFQCCESTLLLKLGDYDVFQIFHIMKSK